MAQGRARARKPATYAELLELPDHVVGEILAGDLYASPRPRFRHARATAWLDRRLGPPFDDGVGGPGGWWILIEPELHFTDEVLVPDLAGWRRERLPSFPDVAYLELAPDLVCEVLSPATERIDRGLKMWTYPREGVENLWFLNPEARTFEVLRLQGEKWLVIGVYSGDETVRAEPFGAIELNLASLWGTA